MKTILHHKLFLFVQIWKEQQTKDANTTFTSCKGEIPLYKVIQLIENNQTFEQTHSTLVYVNNRHYIYHHRVKAVWFIMNAA